MRLASSLYSRLCSRPPSSSGDLSRSASTAKCNSRGGETAEISAGLPSPSQLPPNGRVAVEFAGFRKALHALDPDFYIVFRAPKAGKYTLNAAVVEDEEPIFNLPRWRESGTIQKVSPYPVKTPWPAGHKVRLRLSAKPVNFGVSKRNLTVEAEPNESIAAGAAHRDRRNAITSPAAPTTSSISTTARSARPGDDWFRIEFQGKTPRLFTANLTCPIRSSSPRFAVLHRRRQGVSRGRERERARSSADSKGIAPRSSARSSRAAFISCASKRIRPATKWSCASADRRRTPIRAQAVRQAMYDHLARWTPGC